MGDVGGRGNRNDLIAGRGGGVGGGGQDLIAPRQALCAVI